MEILMKNLTSQNIISELKLWDEYQNFDFSSLSEDEIMNLWTSHLQKHSYEIEAHELVETCVEESILIDTPDGYQFLGDFYIKSPRNIHEIQTQDGKITKVSEDHLFQTMRGWIKTKDLKPGEMLLSKQGWIRLQTNQILSFEEVYDWEVLHENHRYWTASGLSSHNTGKTFLSLNMCREAQNLGYDIIYCDSEAAVDEDVFVKFGLDPNRVRYQPVSTVQEFSVFVNNLTKMLNDAKNSGIETPKIMLVLDSLGNLASSKEKEDQIAGKQVRDMTKQQVIRTLFRTATVDLAAHKIPFVITNHTYQGIGLFATKEIPGGGGAVFNPSIILMLSKAKLKENVDQAKKAEMNSTGIVVTSTVKKNRFARPIPIKFHISFFRGMNKYTGLEKYISWETCGIGRGKLYTQKEYDKWKPETKAAYDHEKYSWVVKEKVVNEDGSQTEVEKRYYFYPKDTSRSFVVKHLAKEIEPSKLFTPEVITQEVLREIDEKAIKPLFMLPDIGGLEELAQVADELEATEEDIPNQEIE